MGRTERPDRSEMKKFESAALITEKQPIQDLNWNPAWFQISQSWSRLLPPSVSPPPRDSGLLPTLPLLAWCGLGAGLRP